MEKLSDKELLNISKDIKKAKNKSKRIDKYGSIDGTPESITKKDINYLKGQIRLAFTRSDYKRAFLESKKLSKPRFTKSGRRHKVDSVYWICRHCETESKASEIEVDHIEEVSKDIEIKSIDDILGFIKNLYCNFDNLQVLCKQCHSHKTKKYMNSINS